MGPISRQHEHTTGGVPTAQPRKLEPIDRVRSVLAATETIEVLIRSNGEPIERVQGQQQSLEMPAGGVAAAGLTDRRIVFCGPSTEAEIDHRVVVPYGEIRAAALDDPRDPNAFEITVETGDTWRLPVAPHDRAAAGHAYRFVEKAIEVWSSVSEAADAVEPIETTMLEPIRNDDWAGTRDRYEDVRSTVTRAQVAVDQSPFAGVERLQHRLEAVQDGLEELYVTALLLRIEKLCAVGHEWLGAGDLDRGLQALATARESLTAASQRVEEYAVQSISGAGRTGPDESFLTGADGVEEALEMAGERIESLARRPIDRGDEARDVAATTDDPLQTIEHLEVAFDRYRTLLYEIWSEPSRFGIDRASLQDRAEQTIGELIEAHTDIAERAAHRAQSAEDAVTEIEAYSEAQNHYETALDLAGEFRAGDPDPIRCQYERVTERCREQPLRPTIADQ